MAEPIGYFAAVAAMLASLVVSGAALYRCSRLPAGHPLLGAVVAACVATNFAAPLLLFDANTCHSTRGMTTFAVSWVASSKAVALFCGRGQLAARRWRLPQFLALYIMPLLPDMEAPSSTAAPATRIWDAPATAAPAAGEGGGSDGSLAQQTAVNAAITAVCLLGAVSGPPLLVKQALLSLAMYGWLGEHAAVGCGQLPSSQKACRCCLVGLGSMGRTPCPPGANPDAWFFVFVICWCPRPSKLLLQHAASWHQRRPRRQPGQCARNEAARQCAAHPRAVAACAHGSNSRPAAHACRLSAGRAGCGSAPVAGSAPAAAVSAALDGGAQRGCLLGPVRRRAGQERGRHGAADMPAALRQRARALLPARDRAARQPPVSHWSSFWNWLQKHAASPLIRGLAQPARPRLPPYLQLLEPGLQQRGAHCRVRTPLRGRPDPAQLRRGPARATQRGVPRQQPPPGALRRLPHQRRHA